MTGTSGGGVDRLADFGRGGGRVRLGGNSEDTADFQLGRTSGDTGDFELSGDQRSHRRLLSSRRLLRLSSSKSSYITEASSTSPSVVGV